MPDSNGSDKHHGFPTWLTQLCYFGGLIVALAAFSFNQSSDLRSVNEKTQRISEDVNAIRQSLPNKEVYDIKIQSLQAEIAQIAADLKLEVLMSQKLRESLIKKRVID